MIAAPHPSMVVMAVRVIMVVAVMVPRHVLGLRVAVQERLHGLAQRVLLEGHMGGQETGQAREHEGLQP
jgi:hypothetical protein